MVSQFIIKIRLTIGAIKTMKTKLSTRYLQDSKTVSFFSFFFLRQGTEKSEKIPLLTQTKPNLLKNYNGDLIF